MNILFISATYLPTQNGVSYYQFHLAQSLRHLGHQVYIFAPQHPQAQPDPSVIRYPAVLTPFVHNYPLGLPLTQLHLLDSLPLDLVHIHHPLTIAKCALKLKKTRHLPFLFTHHTQYLQYFDTYVPYLTHVSAAYLNHDLLSISRDAFKIICPTQAIQAGLKKLGITNTTVIENGIELSKFKPLIVKHTTSLKLIYIGRLEKEKNLLPLIGLTLALKKAKLNFHLTLVGDGHLRPQLESMAKTAKLSPNLTFTGPLTQPAIQKLLPQQHLFVSFSKTEVMPLSYIEALACGVPLCLTQSGQIEGLTNSQNTLTISESPKIAATQILALYSQPATHATLSYQAAKWAQKYDIHQSARQILKLYHQALK